MHAINWEQQHESRHASHKLVVAVDEHWVGIGPQLVPVEPPDPPDPPVPVLATQVLPEHVSPESHVPFP